MGASGCSFGLHILCSFRGPCRCLKGLAHIIVQSWGRTACYFFFIGQCCLDRWWNCIVSNNDKYLKFARSHTDIVLFVSTLMTLFNTVGQLHPHMLPISSTKPLTGLKDWRSRATFVECWHSGNVEDRRILFRLMIHSWSDLTRSFCFV